MEGVAASLIFVLLMLFLYFAPGLIALHRRHLNGGAIFVLNLFLGWTLIGWVLSLVWAFTSNVKAPVPKQ